MTRSALSKIFCLLPALTLLFAAQNLHAQTATYTEYDAFKTAGSTLSPGSQPNSPIVQGFNGAWYGTLQSGGNTTSPLCAALEEDEIYGCGAIFSATVPGSSTILYTFTGGADGGYPLAGLVLGTDGNFYGATSYGGYESGTGNCETYGCGTIFKVTPSGTMTTLHSFEWTDGAYPQSALVQGADGNFYGTTFLGGDATGCEYDSVYEGCGTIFRYNPTTNVFTTLYMFKGEADEGNPVAGLLQASDGNLYGTSTGYYGAAVTITQCGDGCGTIFKYNLSSNTLTTMYSFSFPDGAIPADELVESSPGVFYGTTESGGADSEGSVFVFNLKEGTLTTLHSFTGSTPDGANPENALFQAGDGLVYGHTAGDGAEGDMFLIAANQTYTELTGAESGEVYEPQSASLVQAGNGLFYGSTVGEDPPRNAECPSVYGCGFLYTVAVSTNPPPAISLTASTTNVEIGTPVTLTWSVNNAFSTTLQQCYAYTTAGGGSGWSGKLTTPVNGVASGTATVSPTAGGLVGYSITCGGTETAEVNFTVGATTTTLTANPSSLVGETPVVLSAAVTSNFGTPTGSVTFSLGSAVLGTSKLNGSGVATYTVNTDDLYEGTYTVSAVYSGNSTLATSSGSTTFDITSSRAQASVLLGSSGLTVSQGSTLILSTNVTGIGDSTVPTGTITFSSGTTSIGTVKLNSSGVGSETIPNVEVPIGPYPIIGTYSGDTNYLPTASAALQVTIKYGTHCPWHPQATGASTVALTTTVTSNGDVTPTGTVTYTDGSTVLGSATLSDGVGTFSASSAGIPAGTYDITSTYNGDASNNICHNTSTVTVLAPTKTVVTSSASTVTPPASVTLTATIADNTGGGIPATGTVTFYFGATVIGTAPVTNGTASYSTATTGVAAGTYQVTARYGGDALDAASTSAAISLQVK